MGVASRRAKMRVSATLESHGKTVFGERRAMNTLAAAAVALILSFAPGNTFAGDAAPKPAPVSDEPAMTTATYADWTLRCQRVGEGDAAQKVCEVAQTIQIQGQQAPIAQFAIGRLPSKALHATIVLPTNISLPSLVHIGGDDPKEKTLDLAWTRCLPNGCYADAVLSDEVLASWRSAAKPRSVKFGAANGQNVEFALSLRGLPKALDALAKQ